MLYHATSQSITGWRSGPRHGVYMFLVKARLPSTSRSSDVKWACPMVGHMPQPEAPASYFDTPVASSSQPSSATKMSTCARSANGSNLFLDFLHSIHTLDVHAELVHGSNLKLPYCLCRLGPGYLHLTVLTVLHHEHRVGFRRPGRSVPYSTVPFFLRRGCEWYSILVISPSQSHSTRDAHTLGSTTGLK